MILGNMIIGLIANRLRGMDVNVLFLNQDDINALIFAGLFCGEWWHIPVLYLAMKLGSATGYTEGILGCLGRFSLSMSEDYNWISKIVKPTDQLTTLLYMCIRATIWILCLEIGLALTIGFSWTLLLAIPLFYVSYRASYYIPFKDKWAVGECFWGSILWSMIYV